jgi:hypothetical protein
MAAVGWRPTIENYLGRHQGPHLAATPRRKTEITKAAEELLAGTD